uniref:Uncharacterized protein n=1 Tax=Anopheles culicifacies TaxID=139723 RepID=A0A182MSP0_9DIPT
MLKTTVTKLYGTENSNQSLPIMFGGVGLDVFKIQFDDSLTSTYEYPSETSLLDTNGFDDADNSTDTNGGGIVPPAFADNGLLSHTNKLLSSVPLVVLKTRPQTIQPHGHDQTHAGECRQHHPTRMVKVNPTIPSVRQQHVAAVAAKRHENWWSQQKQLNSYQQYRRQQYHHRPSVAAPFVLRTPETTVYFRRVHQKPRATLTTTTRLVVDRSINNNGGGLHSNGHSSNGPSDTILNGSAGEPLLSGTGEPESIQYLKPASDEQTVNWSQGTRVTDLLF